MFCMISLWTYSWPSDLEKVHPFVLMIVKFDKYVAHNNTNVVQIKNNQRQQTKNCMPAIFTCWSVPTSLNILVKHSIGDQMSSLTICVKPPEEDMVVSFHIKYLVGKEIRYFLYLLYLLYSLCSVFTVFTVLTVCIY